MYGENQRLSEGIPSTTILINIAAFIRVYTVAIFSQGTGFTLCFIYIFFFKPEILYQF